MCYFSRICSHVNSRQTYITGPGKGSTEGRRISRRITRPFLQEQPVSSRYNNIRFSLVRKRDEAWFQEMVTRY